MAVPAKELTTKQVAAVRFSFYTDAEIKKLSAKRILSPLTLDNLKNVVPDGLYDTAMGPNDNIGRCKTCGLGATACPGHFGHIELPVPVYNPLVFNMLYRLSRCACFNCFKFRMSREDVDKFITRLQKLHSGKLADAVAVSTARGQASKGAMEIAAAFGDDDRELYSGKGLEEDDCCKPGPLTAHTLEAIQDTITEFFHKMPTAKCANCKACSPVIKRHNKTRLFRSWRSKKQVLDNLKMGVVIRGALENLEVMDILNNDVAEEEAQKAEAARKRKAKQGGDRKKKDEDEDGFDDPMDLDERAKAQEESEDEDGTNSEDDHDDRNNDAAMDATDKANAQAAAASMTPTFMTPLEVEAMMHRLWDNEWPLLSLIFGSGAAIDSLNGKGGKGVANVPLGRKMDPERAKGAWQMFFLRTVPVAPNKFRPMSVMNGEKYEHQQNILLQKILQSSLELSSVQTDVEAAQAAAKTQQGGTGPDLAALQKASMTRWISLWLTMQNHVCALIDSTLADGNVDTQGIRQALEKKEGLFRKNMMGKRVNFAARSVISPDPYIGAGEIGVPPYFAQRLSFPERVTPHNVERLRQSVIRGAHQLNGAVAVEDESGKMVLLDKMTQQRREALAKQLMSSTASGGRNMRSGGAGAKAGGSAVAAGPGKIVYRHLQDGDIMLTNRQPTLHKPGLMAHRARVLKGERTIRFHYSNCSTFNADFDGDEINLHLPQDHLGRAEGYYIVHADQQYIVPTDGKPIRGLIQDHVVSGVLLCKRDTWLTKAQYSQLVYVACTAWRRPGARPDAPEDIEMEPPTILKPGLLWSGKQVVSTVVRHYTRGLPPLTFSAGGKVPADYWGRTSGEVDLVFHKGTLVSGVVDKNAFGKFGLVHAMQELYGNTVAGQLLSAFSRLFTFYLQWHGFTCGVDDLLLVPQAESQRQAILDTAEAIAVKASAEFVGLSVPEECVKEPRKNQRKLMLAEQQVVPALAERYRSNKDTGKAHDMKGSGVMHPLSSAVVKVCLPGGQVKAFPKNTLSLMTISGAKGSLVNFSQISCLLGQQELEGRRVPRMSSGKTLPCFRAFDAGARSCGFVGDRFLSGLRPQEYYFHCMAGREGLVDTTVKTSRSGYLQRCLVKNLESLRVHYDSTVRDNCDNSIVQFYYGDDGLDVMNVSYMRQFGFLARNAQRFGQQLDLNNALASTQIAHLESAEAKASEWWEHRQLYQSKVDKAKAEASAGDAEADDRIAKYERKLQKQLPVMAQHSPAVLGSVSEAFGDALAKYVAGNPDGLLVGKEAKGKKSKAVVSPTGMRPTVDGDTFTRLMQLKFMRALAAPGEAVGVLAAQSVGEPSTQMTLNTFHMAGRGEANVTLGIPRLREILMTAAARIKTPVMTLPLNKGLVLQDAQVLANRMRRLRLAECLSGITVEETPVARVPHMASGYGRVYRITLQFFRPDQFPADAGLTFDQLASCFRASFCNRLKSEVDKESRKKAGAGAKLGTGIASSLLAGTEDAAGAAAAAPAGDEEGGEGAGASMRSKKKKSEKDDDFEDHESDDELREGKLRFRGGRGEAATYDGPDEDDAEVARAAERAARQRALNADDDEEMEEGPSGVGAQRAQADDTSSDDEEGDAAGPGPGSAADAAAASAAKGKAAAKGKKGAAGSKAAVAAAAAAGGAQLLPDEGAADVDCERFTAVVRLALPLGAPKLLMLELVERVAATTMVRETANIEKVYVIAGERGEGPKVQTDGINFGGVWANADLVDVNGITTNDVAAMLRTYGVEAARATIMREVQSVFGAYGIGVDPRHLGLIADFMTHQGAYRACNRIGIESSVSPFLKMSFETAAHFLTDATLKNAVDDLKSPSARLCVGQVVELGTGSMGILQNLS